MGGGCGWLVVGGWWCGNRDVADINTFLSVGVSKIILILTRGIHVNYANLRGICEIFPRIK